MLAGDVAAVRGDGRIAELVRVLVGALLISVDFSSSGPLPASFCYALDSLSVCVWRRRPAVSAWRRFRLYALYARGGGRGAWFHVRRACRRRMATGGALSTWALILWR